MDHLMYTLRLLKYRSPKLQKKSEATPARGDCIKQNHRLKKSVYTGKRDFYLTVNIDANLFQHSISI